MGMVTAAMATVMMGILEQKPDKRKSNIMLDHLEKGMKRERVRLLAHLKGRGYLKTAVVEEAMLRVPRHLFVPDRLLGQAHVDSPLSIGEEQTISAPHMVAIMAEELDIKPGERLLEVGGGSGYHAAVYAYLAGPEGLVVSLERVGGLVRQGARNLKELGRYEIPLSPIRLLHRDGKLGYPEAAPYHKISVACTASSVPQALVEQLAEDGVMVLPVGPANPFHGQELLRVERKDGEILKKRLASVAFVPLKTGTR